MRTNLLNYFDQTVACYPDKTAIIDEDKTIVFSELSQRSRKLSWIISSMTEGVLCRPVAVYTKKCIGSVISDIAIMYSGNAYMNLDVKTPSVRIGGILSLIEPVLVITDDSNAKALAEMWPLEKTINLDEIDFDRLIDNQADIDKTLSSMIDTDPLCIINTSGSTGVPKGVVLNHRSFLDFTEWAKEVAGIGENEVIGCLSPIVFDIYSFELCMLMSRASIMVLLQESMAAFPARILQTLIDRKVTFIFWVPTIMVNIANMGLLEKLPLPDLATVWFAGEVFPTKQLNIWSRFPLVMPAGIRIL